MIKKISVFVLVILSFSSLAISGCWSRQEVENLAIASSFGIDKEDLQGTPKYKITYNIFKPSQAGGAESGSSSPGTAQFSPIWQLSALGDTLQDAFANIAIRSPRDLFVGHVKLIVLSKDVAEQGVQQIVDYLLRNDEIRLRTWLVVVDGKAQEALRALPDLERTIAEQSSGVAEHTRNMASKYYTENLNQFVHALEAEGKEPVLGRVLLIKPTPPKIETEKDTTSLAFRGIAVFSNDKFAGWLEDDETKGFLYIIGKSRRGVIPVSIGKGRPTVSLEMKDAESQIISEVVDGKVHVTVKIKAVGSLQEEGRSPELASPQGMKEMSSLFAQEIKQLCMQSVKKAQQYKTDIFGFGAVLHRKNSGQWHEVQKEWPELFAEAQVDIEVKAKIISTGVISERIMVKP